MELNTDIRQLQSSNWQTRKKLSWKQLYRVGIGNFNTGLGELYINTGRMALQTGFLKRLNQKEI